ncbi:hypothetical protein GN958_ATG14629 [Phytophthora infestans]|uniref:Uncharacterized protein n=1 Tax=Phytophthora infestans TaxID=4787 RepID=A0A8S9UAB5_PHYIN|nr:hypothetical protein GN958_ATG14629 [Phytophthora infestans]
MDQPSPVLGDEMVLTSSQPPSSHRTDDPAVDDLGSAEEEDGREANVRYTDSSGGRRKTNGHHIGKIERNNQGEPLLHEPGTEAQTGDVSEDNTEPVPDDELYYYSEMDSKKVMYSQPEYDSKYEIGVEPNEGDNITEGYALERIPLILTEHRPVRKAEGSVLNGVVERQRNKASLVISAEETVDSNA